MTRPVHPRPKACLFTGCIGRKGARHKSTRRMYRRGDNELASLLHRATTFSVAGRPTATDETTEEAGASPRRRAAGRAPPAPTADAALVLSWRADDRMGAGRADERWVTRGAGMKKLINRPEDAVKEELEGIAAAHADRLRVHPGLNYIGRADAPVRGKVAIVSGGGSGHEPMHGGFVGMGMLDAACPGEVFTSPTPDQMLDAAKAVNGGAGVLSIVKNYTGDVMNFEMAAELARGEGIEVEQVVIDDDVAVKDSLYTAGRRGVGATVLAEKICGAAAEQRRPLPDVAGVCRKVNANARSMGMALTSCTVPMAGKPTFELGADEMEIGIGIHGEPGRERRKLAPAHEIVEALATAVVEDLPFSCGDEVLAFVNGMGGTPLMELYVVYNELHKLLEGRGIAITRNLIGSYITSLDMAGCSITLLRLDDELTALWDAPVNTTGLRWGVCA